ncbi:MAG: glycosyltransferase family 4 protein [Patescibacteria group bacterium]
MNLLILAQKVDKTDGVLGFFHNWVNKLSTKFDHLTVICLEQGDYDLPPNVKVLSLGKEQGQSRLKYIWRFYKYIWQERHNYDAVFVHMNQEYILLGGLFWKIFNKKVFLWRNHPIGNYLTKIAVWWSNVVFCTSPYSYTARFSKTKLMPVGIDTDYFLPLNGIKRTKDILFVGRLDRLKRPDILLKTINMLKKNGLNLSTTFIGESTPGNESYRIYFDQLIKKYDLVDNVFLMGAIPNTKTKYYYQTHKVFINLAPSGCLDKTIFEAMACGSDILVTNNYLRSELGINVWTSGEVDDLVKKISEKFSKNKISQEDNITLVNYVKKNHSLDFLVKAIKNYT